MRNHWGYYWSLRRWLVKPDVGFPILGLQVQSRKNLTATQSLVWPTSFLRNFNIGLEACTLWKKTIFNTGLGNPADWKLAKGNSGVATRQIVGAISILGCEVNNTIPPASKTSELEGRNFKIAKYWRLPPSPAHCGGIPNQTQSPGNDQWARNAKPIPSTKTSLNAQTAAWTKYCLSVKDRSVTTLETEFPPRKTFDQLLTDFWPTSDQLLTDFWPTSDQLLTNSWLEGQ